MPNPPPRPSPPPPPPPVAPLQNVVNVLDQLSSSVHSQMVVPGEAPVVLQATDSSILAVLQLDSTANTSRLFTKGITSPSGLSSFDGLPPGVFRGLPNSSAVRTQFYELSFSPYPDSDSPDFGAGAKITRLQFGDAVSGSEVAVGNLSVPITFEIPAAGSGAEQGDSAAGCRFWDVKAQRYSTAGCGAQPLFAPQAALSNLNVVWNFSLPAALLPAAALSNLTSEQLIALSWDLQPVRSRNGTALPNLASRCKTVFLDCRNGTGRAFLDPNYPLTPGGLVECDAPTDDGR